MLVCHGPSKRSYLRAIVLPLCLLTVIFLASCNSQGVEDPELLRNVHLDLIDWHISGLGIINSPVAWVRITNNNPVPVGDIVLRYTTYDYEGQQLNEGTYPLEPTIGAGQVQNFMELYLGLVDVNSEKLSVQVESVKRAE